MASKSLEILQNMKIETVERMAEKGCEFYGKNGKLFISISNTFDKLGTGSTHCLPLNNVASDIHKE